MLAVSKIQEMIARCTHLKAYVSTNDKTPFTDGYIDLYSKLRQSKKDWQGRVPLQVKGRSYRAKRGESMTYPVSRVDLLGYQKDSGVLYFVVAVDSKTGRRTAFYKNLSPFAIEAILRDVAQDDTTVSVVLNRLPEEPPKIESLVAVALKTRNENVSVGFDPALFEHMSSLTLHTPFALDFNSPITLVPGSNDYSLVLNTANGLSIPLDGELHVLPPAYAERSIDFRVRAGDIEYVTAIVQQLDEETIRAQVADSLALTFKIRSGEVSVSVALTLADSLAERVKSVEFFTALLIDHEPLEINGDVSERQMTPTSEDAGLLEHRGMLRDMTALFARLGVDTRCVDLTLIDQIQAKQLHFLYRAFVRGEEITDPSAEVGRVLQPVGAWNVMYLISPGSAAGKWRLLDPFSAEIRSQFRVYLGGLNDSEPVPATAYDAAMPDDVGTVLNSRLDSIVAAYEQIADFPHTADLANNRVLALIEAADAHAARREDLLDAAESLNDWLVARTNEQPQHLINRYQIRVRRRSLTPREKLDIRQVKRGLLRSGVSNALQMEIACALILRDADEVDYLLSQATTEQARQLKGWPIWKLHSTL